MSLASSASVLSKQKLEASCRVLNIKDWEWCLFRKIKGRARIHDERWKFGALDRICLAKSGEMTMTTNGNWTNVFIDISFKNLEVVVCNNESVRDST